MNGLSGKARSPDFSVRDGKPLKRRTPGASPADGLSQEWDVLVGVGLPDRRSISSIELAISFL